MNEELVARAWARMMRKHVDACTNPECALCAKYGHEAAEVDKRARTR